MVKNFSSKKMLACLLFCGVTLGVNVQGMSLDQINKEYANIENALISGDLYAAKCSWMRLQKSGLVSRDYRFYYQRARLERAMAVECLTSSTAKSQDFDEMEYIIAIEAIKSAAPQSEDYNYIRSRIKELADKGLRASRIATYQRMIERAQTLGLVKVVSKQKTIDYRTTLENIVAANVKHSEEFKSEANVHYQKALVFLDKAIELSNHTSILYKERAEIYKILNNVNEVIKNYDRFVKLSPYSVDGFFRKAEAYYEKACLSDYESAEEYLSISIRDLTKALQLLDEYLTTTRDQIQITRAKEERRTFEELERNQVDLRARLDDKILNDNKKNVSDEKDIDIEDGKEAKKEVNESESEVVEDEATETTDTETIEENDDESLDDMEEF